MTSWNEFVKTSQLRVESTRAESIVPTCSKSHLRTLSWTIIVKALISYSSLIITWLVHKSVSTQESHAEDRPQEARLSTLLSLISTKRMHERRLGMSQCNDCLTDRGWSDLIWSDLIIALILPGTVHLIAFVTDVRKERKRRFEAHEKREGHVRKEGGGRTSSPPFSLARGVAPKFPFPSLSNACNLKNPIIS